MAQQQVHKPLISLIADGKFHSGTELAAGLGLSRSTVWKHLRGLTTLGIDVKAVPGKGYRLGRPLHLLSKTEILANLAPSSASRLTVLDIHDTIASTNAYLMERGLQGAASGHVCLAEYQSAGRGRRGRRWISPFGHNVYLSLLWHYPDGPASIAGLSLAVGVAVVRALNALGIHDVMLKWPNDIYWQQRKLGGVLIDVSGETGGPCFAVIGLGLNVYMPQQSAKAIDQPWIDLETIVGALPPTFRNRLLAALIDALLPVVADFDAAHLPDYLPEWRQLDALKGKPAILMAGNQPFEGIATGINDAGMLLMTLAGGTLRPFASGDVTFQRP